MVHVWQSGRRSFPHCHCGMYLSPVSSLGETDVSIHESMIIVSLHCLKFLMLSTAPGLYTLYSNTLGDSICICCPAIVSSELILIATHSM